MERVRADLPTVSIYFIGITPSPRRWEIWNQAQRTNRLVREWSALDPALFYIETGPALLGEGGGRGEGGKNGGADGENAGQRHVPKEGEHTATMVAWRQWTA